jgi:hypothetical protein
MLNAMNEQYGDVLLLVVSQGKVHDYLGMTLDFSDNAL